MRVWRICRREYADSAFSGDGGLHGPGRWHHQGVRVVYTSQSLELAILETWVHVGESKAIADHVSVAADIPADVMISDVAAASLPPDWTNTDPRYDKLRNIGTNWLKSMSTAATRVPSVVTRGAFNYLLNPLHADFVKITRQLPEQFEYDPRMWKR